jgi:hypothetical protein
MIYTKGDNVRFKLESGEVEKNKNEEIYYINSSSRCSRWAYKIPGKAVSIDHKIYMNVKTISNYRYFI